MLSPDPRSRVETQAYGYTNESFETAYEYDNLNRPWRTVAPADADGVQLVTETVFNIDGSVMAAFAKDQNDNVLSETRYTYDGLGRVGSASIVL